MGQSAVGANMSPGCGIPSYGDANQHKPMGRCFAELDDVPCAGRECVKVARLHPFHDDRTLGYTVKT